MTAPTSPPQLEPPYVPGTCYPWALVGLFPAGALPNFKAVRITDGSTSKQEPTSG